jgi:hypothetical protein
VAIVKLCAYEQQQHPGVSENRMPRRRPIGKRRPARCPACGHQGSVPCDAPMAARLRCVACSTSVQVRQAIGPRPAIFHHRPSKRNTRTAIASAIFKDCGSPTLDDDISDLWVRS